MEDQNNAANLQCVVDHGIESVPLEYVESAVGWAVEHLDEQLIELVGLRTQLAAANKRAEQLEERLVEGVNDLLAANKRADEAEAAAERMIAPELYAAATQDRLDAQAAASVLREVLEFYAGPDMWCIEDIEVGEWMDGTPRFHRCSHAVLDSGKRARKALEGSAPKVPLIPIDAAFLKWLSMAQSIEEIAYKLHDAGIEVVGTTKGSG